ncbi:MAG: bacillithiol biosynthesis deacetylase BshB1 [Nitrospinae bacterium]|nr:bacillithiol biosynthesis deacetylase BshB1 [Nitrospinota bacterium]
MVDFLAVGTHPDDVEIGVGGALASLIMRGNTCAVLDLTSGEPTPHGTPETRAEETKKSNAMLGVTQRINLGLPNRRLMDSPEARIKVAEVYRTLRPKVLFLPYWVDAHPDHIQSSQLSQSARFVAKYTKTDMAGDPFYPPKVFYYFCSHLKKIAEPVSFVLDVSAGFEKKMAAIRAYHSQFFAGDPARGEDLLRRIEAQAVYFGGLVGARYGEPFFSHETIGLASLDVFLS